MRFQILKKSKKSGARLGFMETSHGVVETPCLVPVATQAVVKTLTSEEAEQTNSQILICNTFHLHLKPALPRRSFNEGGGEKIVEKAGGLHKFMNWKRPLMTDSGGYQVFSLGFGKDFVTGKILTRKNAETYAGKRGSELISHGRQPREIKITEEGVHFRSPVDGTKLFLGPAESIKIQEALAADIIFTFDECPPPQADWQYLKKSLEKTHKWAEICLKVKSASAKGSGATKQALFGIVQGGKFKDLRNESAKFIGFLSFDGFGIGGEFGEEKSAMAKMIKWVVKELPEKKPRHLLGVGHLDDIKKIIQAGIDSFDCTVPTHYARHGVAFTSHGKLDLKQSKFLKKREPLDKNCVCQVCLNYKKDYICHLLKAGEITALRLLTFHNLYYFNEFVAEIRNKIKRGEL